MDFVSFITIEGLKCSSGLHLFWVLCEQSKTVCFWFIETTCMYLCKKNVNTHGACFDYENKSCVWHVVMGPWPVQICEVCSSRSQPGSVRGICILRLHVLYVLLPGLESLL